MLLLVKLRNSAELFWDTLDSEERLVLIYVALSFVVSVITTLRTVQRESFKREVIAEVFDELSEASTTAREAFKREVIAEVSDAHS